MAKISDLGNYRTPNMRPGQLVMMMSEVPGTAVYMPPEALQGDSQYGTHLDGFSFGHLALYVMIQVVFRMSSKRSATVYSYDYFTFMKSYRMLIEIL